MDAPKLKKQKSLLRKELRLSLKGLNSSRRRLKSLRILRRLLATTIFKNSRYFFTYVSTEDEADTRRLILAALSQGKTVFLPRILKRNRMEACRIRRFPQDVKRGQYGILEPRSFCRRIPPACLDLIVVPGLGFDRRGSRLGRGLGYFDRFLAKTRRAKKIGIAFREQMLKKIPTGPHDIPMDRVITD